MKTLIGAAIAVLAIAVPGVVRPVGAAPASACTATSGVTVIVDFTHFAGGKIERGCAPGHPANALVALHAAGFSSAGTAQYGDAFVCRIDGLPKPKQDACAVTPSATAFWAFWSARPSDSKWTYSAVGVLDDAPQPGSIKAFAFGDHAQPRVTPGAAIAPPTTTTTKPAPPPTSSPPTQPPAVSPATLPPAAAAATTTTDVPISALGSTTTTAAAGTTTRPTPGSSTTRVVQSTTSTVAIVERSASGPTADGSSSGSPLAAILTIAIVGGLAIGAFAFTRARRNRPA